MATRIAERMERKFFFGPNKAGAALGFLRLNCRYDGDFPLEQINSLYFDTPDLDQHERSLSGEYAKDKIRIRWYGYELDPHGGRVPAFWGDEVPVWLERKSRAGFASNKVRESLVVPASALSPQGLAHGIIPYNELALAVGRLGFFPGARLVPIVAISYLRHRFTEPATGFHVALDSHIRSTVVRPGLGRSRRGLELPGAVVEIKGPSFELPRLLRGLGRLGTSWTRYSKYSASLEAHLSFQEELCGRN